MLCCAVLCCWLVPRPVGWRRAGGMDVGGWDRNRNGCSRHKNTHNSGKSGTGGKMRKDAECFPRKTDKRVVKVRAKSKWAVLGERGGW